MVDKKRVTKYVVAYNATVVVELNEDLTVIAHHMHCDNESVECIGNDEIIELFPNSTVMDGVDDYSAITGNALSYVNGLTLVFGAGEDNGEPF